MNITSAWRLTGCVITSLVLYFTFKIKLNLCCAVLFLQLIDNLFHSNLPEIVVEVLMTLHESVGIAAQEDSDLTRFTGYSFPFSADYSTCWLFNLCKQIFKKWGWYVVV